MLPSNKYAISYTIFDRLGKSPPQHKKYEFESGSDLLAALEEGMTVLFVKHDQGNSKTYILFRGLELTNAKEIYQATIEQEKRNAEQKTS